MKTFAIVVICYERLDGIKRLLKCLESADYCGRDDIELIFSIDNSGNDRVEKFAKHYLWPHGNKTIRTFPERQGLKNHILQCGDFTAKFDILTLFEDDIYVSDSFYHFAYGAAEQYWDDDNIAGISLYSFQKNWLDKIYRFEPQKRNYDNYFMKIAQSWGQVWTYSKWSKFKEWYLENEEFIKEKSIPYSLNLWPDSSWLKYHDKYCIETNKYFVYPYISLTTNFSDVGQHAKVSVSDHQVELQYGKKDYLFSPNTSIAIRYDEYMEREGLAKYLDVDNRDLCVNIWGKKDKSMFKKYLLSTQALDFEIVKSFSLALRPIELNIIQMVPGENIFLYDTTKVKRNKKRVTEYELLQYSIRSHDFKNLLNFSLRLTSKSIRQKLNLFWKKNMRQWKILYLFNLKR